jgi:hypothetical protein
VLHGYEVIAAADLDGDSIIFEPSLWLGLAIELSNPGC